MRVIIAAMNTTKEDRASACIAGQVEPFYKRVFQVTFQILRRDFFDAIAILEGHCALFSDLGITLIHFIDSNQLSLNTNYLSGIEN